MRLGLRLRNCEMLSVYRTRWALYCGTWCIGLVLAWLCVGRFLPNNSMEQLIALFLLTFPTLMALTAMCYFGLGAICARFVTGDRKLKCFGIPRTHPA
jgi:hypothetical protein